MSAREGIATAGAINAELAQAGTGTTPDVLRQQINALREELDRIERDYRDRVTRLEAALAALAPAAAPAPLGAPPESPQTAPGSSPVAAPAPPSSSRAFTPDIAVIGNFFGTGGRNPVEASPAFEMREAELSLQAAVDPYARADVFLSFGESGVNLEEGFMTFATLPGGLLVKAGKMRAAFGKVNTMHTHALPWADRPLVTRNLLGGEDGLDDAGVSVARLIPNRWLFLEGTGQVFRGASEGIFTSSRLRDVAYVGHLRAYRDITENSNLDLGLSYARGRAFTPTDSALSGPASTLVGVDATWHWRPLQRAIYRSFVGRSEIVWNRQATALGPGTSVGYFVSGDYQLARRWYGGVRFDRSDRMPGVSLLDRGGSFALTYRPSEFSQLRGQYRRTAYAGATTADEVLFQAQFSIGAHGAHAF